MTMKTRLLLEAVDAFSRPVRSAKKSLDELSSQAKSSKKDFDKLGQQQETINKFQQVAQSVKSTKVEMKQARMEAGRLTQSEEKLRDELAQVDKKIKQVDANLLKLAEAHGANSKQVKRARSELNALIKSRKKANDALKEEGAKLRGAKRHSDRLTNSFSAQAQTLGKLRKGLTSAGINTNALGAEQLRLKRKSDAASASLERQTASLKKMQAAQGRIDARKAQRGELVGDAFEVAAAVAPMVYASKKSIGYEARFADVEKVVNFSSEEEEAKYSKALKRKAAQVGGKNAQLGMVDIVAAAGRSGIEKDQLLNFAEKASKMGIAFEMSAEKAGKTRATWRAAMGLDSDQADDLADATNYLSDNMNAEAKDISAVMVRRGATAMQAGFGQNEAAALAATLVAGGETEETASTALKNISGRLTKGYAATGNEREAMSRLGYDPEELAQAMQADAKGTLVEVLRAIQGEDEASQGAVISQLFGEEVKGAVAKMVMTLDDDKNGLIKAFSRVANKEDRKGSVDREYEIRAATRAHKLSVTVAKFDNMATAIGDRLNPILDAALPVVDSFLTGVTFLAEEMPQATSVILAGAAGVAVFKTAMIGAKLARLALGNGADKLTMSREKLRMSTLRSATDANKAASAIARMNAQMAATGRRRPLPADRGAGVRRYSRNHAGARGGRFSSFAASAGDILAASGGYMPGYGFDDDSDRKRKTRRKPKGRFGRAAASVGDFVSGRGAKLASRATPAAVLLTQGAMLASSAIDGDAVGAASAAGGMGGGMAGAAAGAAIGTAILPGIGTAIGGAIGGLAGSELGASLAESIALWMSEDKTEQPPPPEVEKVSKTMEAANKLYRTGVKVEVAPNITIVASGDPEKDKAAAVEARKQMEALSKPMFSQAETTYAALTDGARD